MMLAAARGTFKDAAAAVHPGLQPLGFTVLMTLYRGGERPQGSVAAALQVDKALLSQTVSQLETLGLVVRRASPSDGRVQLLDLTPEGLLRYANAHSAKRALLRDRLGSWTSSELHNLADLLKKLNERDLFRPRFTVRRVVALAASAGPLRGTEADPAPPCISFKVLPWCILEC